MLILYLRPLLKLAKLVLRLVRTLHEGVILSTSTWNMFRKSDSTIVGKEIKSLGIQYQVCHGGESAPDGVLRYRLPGKKIKDYFLSKHTVPSVLPA